MALLVGQYLGNYYILEHLGQGGYANVYRCEHSYLKTERAIKIASRPLKKEDEDNFLNEVKLHAQMHHSNIVGVYDSGEINNHLFLVMDYAPYDTLRQLSGQRLDPPTLVSYVKQTAEALQYIHGKNVIH